MPKWESEVREGKGEKGSGSTEAEMPRERQGALIRGRGVANARQYERCVSVGSSVKPKNLKNVFVDFLQNAFIPVHSLLR